MGRKSLRGSGGRSSRGSPVRILTCVRGLPGLSFARTGKRTGTFKSNLVVIHDAGWRGKASQALVHRRENRQEGPGNDYWAV